MKSKLESVLSFVLLLSLVTALLCSEWLKMELPAAFVGVLNEDGAKEVANLCPRLLSAGKKD